MSTYVGNNFKESVKQRECLEKYEGNCVYNEHDTEQFAKQYSNMLNWVSETYDGIKKDITSHLEEQKEKLRKMNEERFKHEQCIETYGENCKYAEQYSNIKGLKKSISTKDCHLEPSYDTTPDKTQALIKAQNIKMYNFLKHFLNEEITKPQLEDLINASNQANLCGKLIETQCTGLLQQNCAHSIRIKMIDEAEANKVIQQSIKKGAMAYDVFGPLALIEVPELPYVEQQIYLHPCEKPLGALIEEVYQELHREISVSAHEEF